MNSTRRVSRWCPFALSMLVACGAFANGLVGDEIELIVELEAQRQ